MKKIWPGMLLGILIFQIGFGQTGKWTWMGGDGISNVSANYGSLGVQATTNKPGGKAGNYYWQDTGNNLYLLGGFGAIRGNLGPCNDFWKYSVPNNKWTWMGGDSTLGKAPVYGLKGVASPSNDPGARSFTVSWTDLDGNFWLMGNGDSQNGSDLWKYNIVTHQWAWMAGDTLPLLKGVYGTKGVQAPTNKPGGRWGSVSWTDPAGNLWMFGGYGYASSGGFNGNRYGFLNDLWRFNISSNQWTWVNGDSIPWVRAVFNLQGIPFTANNPGARHSANAWTDLSGNLWLFGGLGSKSHDTVGLFNDLWSYNISTNMWTWVKGDSTVSGTAVFGVQGVPFTTNKPGARWVGSSCTDFHGNFWLFGGKGLAFNNQEKLLNDLWKYSPSTNEWTLVKADTLSASSQAVYGTLGVSSVSNIPQGETGTTLWSDRTGNLWLFGGGDYVLGYFNNLWRFSTDTLSFPLHLLTFTAKRANNSNLLKWTTATELNTDRFDIERSPNGREFSKIGSVKANSSNGQYEYMDNQLRNEKQESVVFYRLKMLDKDGQFTYSPIRQLTNNHLQLTIAPNPARNIVTISGANFLTITLSDNTGRIVLAKSVGSHSSVELSVTHLPKGLYLLTVTTIEGNIESERLVVE